LEMRELQKEGKIGRIEVEVERKDKRTIGKIQIPTALDQSETTLIAAAIETIERVGPCDAQIEVERIEDVRGSKRDYIIERAKKLMKGIEGSTDSKQISNEIKDAAKMANISEYGEEKLPCGDLSGKEIIVVEGRADVLNLLRNGVNNVIAMNGTKLPNAIKELGREKEITLFVDGDRGGKLIAENVVNNANITYIAIAPDGKEVEELAGKEILMNLRKKVSVDKFFGREMNSNKPEEKPAQELSKDEKEFLKKTMKDVEGSGRAIIFNNSLEEIKQVSVKSLNNGLKKLDEKIKAIVMDGTVTSSVIQVAEEFGCQAIVASNFATTDSKMELLSL
ncbi:MAG: toprim domain-containing protein, partial [Nanoarchaeota archaeon]|nr:toprim domain-containing protein [Nanoarchaeota archaeon]